MVKANVHCPDNVQGRLAAAQAADDVVMNVLSIPVERFDNREELERLGP